MGSVHFTCACGDARYLGLDTPAAPSLTRQPRQRPIFRAGWDGEPMPVAALVAPSKMAAGTTTNHIHMLASRPFLPDRMQHSCYLRPPVETNICAATQSPARPSVDRTRSSEGGKRAFLLR